MSADLLLITVQPLHQLITFTDVFFPLVFRFFFLLPLVEANEKKKALMLHFHFFFFFESLFKSIAETL